MTAVTVRKIESQADRDAAFEQMTGWTRREIEKCVYHRATDTIREHPQQPGCCNKATWEIGTQKLWWLCDECAALPRFKRFTRRFRIIGS